MNDPHFSHFLENSEGQDPSQSQPQSSGGGSNDTEPQQIADFRNKIDIDALLHSYLSHWIWILVLPLVVFIGSFLYYRYTRLNAPDRYTAQAILFHQVRSEKLPSFYKQLSTSSIVAKISTSSVFEQVAGNMHIGGENAWKVLASRTQIKTEKNQNGIITIIANANTPQSAAELANQVASSGVSVYVMDQNSTLDHIIKERETQVVKMENELEKLEDRRQTFIIPSTIMADAIPQMPVDLLDETQSQATANSAEQTIGEIPVPQEEQTIEQQQIVQLPPDEELTLIKRKLSEIETYQTQAIAQQASWQQRVSAGEAQMKVIPKEIRYFNTVRAAQSTSLDTLQQELERMMMQYTDANPIVRQQKRKIEDEQARLDRIAADPSLEPAVQNDEVVYKANDVYIHLEEDLYRARISAAASQAILRQYDVIIAKYKERIRQLTAILPEYYAIIRQIDSIKNNIDQKQKSIHELQMLLSTAVPDLSIMEEATPPLFENSTKSRYISLILTAMTFALVSVVILLGEFMLGKIKTSKELSILLGSNDLGMLLEGAPDYMKESFQHEFLNRLTNGIAGSKARILLAAVMPGTSIQDYQTLFSNIVEGMTIQGKKVFRLQAIANNQHPMYENPVSVDEEENDFISIEAAGNRGVFHYENMMAPNATELTLLKVDLDSLLEKYDVILLETATPIDCSSQRLDIFVGIADYTMLVANFNITPKTKLRGVKKQIRANKKAPAWGGLVINVKKPYWSK